MKKERFTTDNGQRGRLAYATLIFSGVAITALAVLIIIRDKTETMTIFNIVLPVFASWVGTILAFYFGRENFESANKQMDKIVSQLSPAQRSTKLVTSIMRPLQNITYIQIPKGKSEQDILIKELRSKFTENISRLPILDFENKPRYIIHESSINKYIAAGGTENDTLEQFISSQRKEGFLFGVDKGFIIVSEQSTISAAKQRMEEMSPCQDTFVTKHGTGDESLTGWISNVRISKFLEN